MPSHLTLTIPGAISQAIKPLALGNYTAVLKTAGGNEMLAGKAIDELQVMVNRILSTAQQARDVGREIDILHVLEVPLSTASTTITTSLVPLIQGEFFVVAITQDGTGGRAITWDTMFLNSPPVYVNTAANAYTQFLFVARQDPTTGAHSWYFVASWPMGPTVTAGTYATGLKLTGGGVNGSITIDKYGRITAITAAT